jgi:hypothetical protein
MFMLFPMLTLMADAARVIEIRLQMMASAAVTRHMSSITTSRLSPRMSRGYRAPPLAPRTCNCEALRYVGLSAQNTYFTHGTN